MRKAKAFTLIELLVVIAVIALLMAILMPSLQRARNQARAVVCQANLKQWGTVLALYADDNEGRIPRGSTTVVWLFRGSWLPDGDPNKPPVYHELTTKGIACCPMAVRVSREPASGLTLVPPPAQAGHSGPWDFCINRHNGYTNGLFLDWSVRKIGLKELWTLKWDPDYDTAGRWTRAGGVLPEDWPEWMRNFKDY